MQLSLRQTATDGELVITACGTQCKREIYKRNISATTAENASLNLQGKQELMSKQIHGHATPVLSMIAAIHSS